MIMQTQYSLQKKSKPNLSLFPKVSFLDHFRMRRLCTESTFFTGVHANLLNVSSRAVTAVCP